MWRIFCLIYNFNYLFMSETQTNWASANPYERPLAFLDALRAAIAAEDRAQIGVLLAALAATPDRSRSTTQGGHTYEVPTPREVTPVTDERRENWGL